MAEGRHKLWWFCQFYLWDAKIKGTKAEHLSLDIKERLANAVQSSPEPELPNSSILMFSDNFGGINLDF